MMKDGTAIKKELGKAGPLEGRVRLYKASRARFCLGFRQSGYGMETDIWLTRDELRTVSDVLLEGLEEEDA